MDSPDYIKRKYYDIIPRSFKTKLDVFLFTRCITDGSIRKFDNWEFQNFRLNDENVSQYEHAWQLKAEDRISKGGPTMSEVDSRIEDWNKNSANFKANLLKEYKIYFITDLFPFSEFEVIFSKDPKERVCHYCKVTDWQIEQLALNGKINTKRDRGYSMEIDRIKPNFEYLPCNVVLACYWCNNAKTDEFSEREFINHVGPGIGYVWEERTAKRDQ